MDRQHTTRALFGADRALIGCVHVAALPGTPKASLPVATIAKQAAAEARHYQDAGLHAVMIENMHDRPYLARQVGPEVVAAMAVVGRAVRDAVDVPLGLQVLAGANQAALGVALAAGAAFVRVEGFVFAHVADEGLMTSDAGALLRYRRAIGAEGIRVFADVKKKHSAHAITADVEIAETAHAAEFFLADGLVVTGVATGRAADAAEVRAVAEAVSIPVLVGSGITPENNAAYPEADAVIVGTALKRDGLW
ncbi:MAG TPA: BtpA/SgcQ family protein, partial [Vicinamibacteria bacterium]